jgi:ribonuclease T1
VERGRLIQGAVTPISRRRAVGLALGLLLALTGASLALAEAGKPADTEPGVPERARATLAEIQRLAGAPPPGHVGGRTFQNRERRLPRGQYREYDVNPRRPGRPRDAERIVIEQRTGKAYYTGDHYRTFVPIE